MEVKDVGAYIASGAAGALSLGALGKMLFQDKVDVYVDARVKSKTEPLETRLKEMEGRMTEAEKQSAVFVQAMQDVARQFGEGVTRLTTTIERVEDRQSETAEAVARIEGAMERRTRER